jgi:hypothetical protein
MKTLGRARALGKVILEVVGLIRKESYKTS